MNEAEAFKAWYASAPIRHRGRFAAYQAGVAFGLALASHQNGPDTSDEDVRLSALPDGGKGRLDDRSE